MAKRKRKCKNCEKLEQRIAAIESELDELKTYTQKLVAALEKSRRGGKRQAAPFRKEKEEDSEPQKPGRKSGEDHGEHAHRNVPETIDEYYEVPLPKQCDCCGSEDLTLLDHKREQYQTDVQVTVVTRQFSIEVGKCVCGATVAGRHDLQTSDATGSAGNQLGPWCHAAFAVLNKSYGLSYGKIQTLFHELLSVKTTRGTIARSVLRTASRCEPTVAEIKEEVRGSPSVTPDETGWRVQGGSAWLHAFATPQAVWYEVDTRRNASVIFRLLGENWNGILIHDGWKPYDSMRDATHQQCMAHLLRRCNELLETAVGGAARFPLSVKKLLKQGLEARDRYLEGRTSAPTLARTAGKLQSEMEALVYPERNHEDNNRFAWFLHNHLDQLFTYLRHPGLEATNWRGEQAIRPAVVNRKVWGGNQTWAGAKAQGILTSVIQTARLKLIDPFKQLRDTLTARKPNQVPTLER